MAINGRSKGNKNERVVAELFKVWTKRPFSRTPSSGGLQWKSTHTKGDIVCTKEGHYFPFCVEVKAHSEIDFSQLLLPVEGCKIMEFWGQCVRDAKLAKKQPLLFMRYNRMPSNFFFVGISMDTWKVIDPLNRLSAITKYIKVEVKPWGLPQLILLPSTQFFNLNYKLLKKALKKRKNERSKTK